MKTQEKETTGTKLYSSEKDVKEIALSNIKLFKDKLFEINSKQVNIKNFTEYIPDWLINKK